MADVLPENLHEPIWFQLSGHKDARDEIEDNVNSLSGKTFLSKFKDVLLHNGWSKSTERYDSEVFAEDWGWCLFMRHEGALIMLGTHVLSPDLSDDEGYQEYLNDDWVDCGLSVEHFHKRTLADRVRGRNKADPTVQERAFRSIWNTLSGLSYVSGLSDQHPDDR